MKNSYLWAIICITAINTTQAMDSQDPDTAETQSIEYYESLPLLSHSSTTSTEKYSIGSPEIVSGADSIGSLDSPVGDTSANAYISTSTMKTLNQEALILNIKAMVTFADKHPNNVTPTIQELTVLLAGVGLPDSFDTASIKSSDLKTFLEQQKNK